MSFVDIKANLQRIEKRVAEAAYRSGRHPDDVTLVAVSKTVYIPEIKDTINCGILDFGENRVQDLIRKIKCIPQARWHMIGRLQSNKVKDIVGKVVLIHSLDRWKLAETINSRGQHLGITVPTLLQVNISGEVQKTGVDPSDVESYLDSIGQLRSIKVCGFMTMAPQSEDPEQARPVFRQLFELREKLKGRRFTNVELKYLSMGMSRDFEVAIEEGANIVRIGSAIFSNA
ncbi:MAG: YggS family pyridoxal phosphate-dependent enzyme [Syntrophomonadaceae bacterium]